MSWMSKIIGYPGFMGFRHMRFKGIWHNILFSRNLYTSGLLGFLNNSVRRTGLYKYLCKREGYKV